MNRPRRVFPSWLNGISLFYAAWVCGVIGFIGPDAAVAIGGAFLLGSAALVAARPNDPLMLRFQRAGLHHGVVTRLFMAALLAIVGVGWLVWALAGSAA